MLLQRDVSFDATLFITSLMMVRASNKIANDKSLNLQIGRHDMAKILFGKLNHDLSPLLGKSFHSAGGSGVRIIKYENYTVKQTMTNPGSLFFLLFL